MRVGLVTTWATACGIAEHSAALVAAVLKADPGIEIVPLPSALDPEVFKLIPEVRQFDLVHLNYHAALHSRWTPAVIHEARLRTGGPISVTYHDTQGPNTEQAIGVIEAADAAIIHEPAYEGINAQPELYYWRMGVPEWQRPTVYDQSPYSWNQGRPILGTVGFPFPWKNYDELARCSRAAGWALLLLAPTATAADVMRWEAINPCIHVFTGFLPQSEVVSRLGGCDATAFCYTCANTGQSGAILQGIAARKPVIALRTCRQFNALYQDHLGGRAIRWCQDFEGVIEHLWRMPITRLDPPTLALAEQESWIKLGAKYAALFRRLVER